MMIAQPLPLMRKTFIEAPGESQTEEAVPPASSAYAEDFH